MPNSIRSSGASARSRPASVVEARVEWRPSRWVLAVLPALGALASCSLLASELPGAIAWPAAVATLAWAGWRARREAGRRGESFVFRSGAPVLVDGVAVDDLVLQWRGPLAFAHWRDGEGRVRRRSWWPDTLPPARRRELRLAAPAGETARGGASMAP